MHCKRSASGERGARPGVARNVSNRYDTSKNDGAIREAGAASSLLFKDSAFYFTQIFLLYPFFFVPLQMKKYSLSAIFHQACLHVRTKQGRTRGSCKLIDCVTGIKNPLIKYIIAENFFSPATRVPWHLIACTILLQCRFSRPLAVHGFVEIGI